MRHWLHAGADKPTILIYGHFDVQPAEPFALAAARIADELANVNHARVDAKKREITDKRIGHQLEGERGERFVVGRLARKRLALLVGAGDGAHIAG